MAKAKTGDLPRVVKLATILVAQQKEVKRLTEELKAAAADALRTERTDLPELMNELGLTEIKLTDGSVIKIEEDADAKITDATRGRALKWLLKNKFGGLIKTQIAIEFGRGDHDTALAAHAALAQKYPQAVVEEGVHHSTLKAFVKEQLRDNKPLPMDLFNVFPYSKAVIKRS